MFDNLDFRAGGLEMLAKLSEQSLLSNVESAEHGTKVHQIGSNSHQSGN